MKPLQSHKRTVQFLPSVNPDTVTLRFRRIEEGVAVHESTICLTEPEIAEALAYMNQRFLFITDIGRVLRVRSWDLTIARLDDTGGGYDGEHSATCWTYQVDSRKLLTAAHKV
jgi:hypothetical protein